MESSWIERSLVEAFDAQLLLVRQPIVHRDGKQCRYELLLRRKTKGQLVSAWSVIKDFESQGTIALLDSWVLRQAFAFLSKGIDLSNYSVNVSSDSLVTSGSENLISQIWDSIRSGQIVSSQFGIELSERYMLPLVGRQDVQSLIAHLRGLGCEIALDDFCEGRHSFQDMISTVQPSSIKIDGSFIKKLTTDSRIAETVQKLVEIAKLYEVQTVAECVEDQATMDRAIELGFDWLQGFHLGRPEPLPSCPS